jgi:LytS/YehU family sensor histidine kinase
MQYLLYETKSPFVSLASEVDFLNKYLELNKLRIEDPTRIEFIVQGEMSGKNVPPLLLLPLVENAVKHGLKGEAENGFVQIFLNVEADSLSLNVKNNAGKALFRGDDAYGGFGLQNLRRRLDLLFTKSYHLAIREEENHYISELKIPL